VPWGPALLLGTVNRLTHNIPSQLCLAIQVKNIQPLQVAHHGKYLKQGARLV